MTDNSKMKRFRFRLRTLFVVWLMVALGISTYRWVQWPARTIQELNDLIEREQYEEAAGRLEYDDDFLVSPGDLVHRVHVARAVVANCQPQRRSLADLIYGRQTYKPVGNQACFVEIGELQAHWLIESMILERGKIRYKWRGPMDPTVRFENGKWVRDEPVLWATPNKANVLTHSRPSNQVGSAFAERR